MIINLIKPWLGFMLGKTSCSIVGPNSGSIRANISAICGLLSSCKIKESEVYVTERCWWLRVVALNLELKRGRGRTTAQPW
jgi:hypothetical protein